MLRKICVLEHLTRRQIQSVGIFQLCLRFNMTREEDRDMKKSCEQHKCTQLKKTPSLNLNVNNISVLN
ncbi:hypothetical protein HanXRQr2_Chr11g0491721 [Helianthus annuus]|uniref:Uncharacterized protein n=1 Tax=Helianthus annuus TaxID=4232 RepID=A0A251S8F7_HELAN|nr:hypothetical protein HanXRQr2_Chr11g0491721 [Helianthus annuus]KAJ0875238.1 hypothetical protein HanPSC8_Chr11g0473841 [Helianthus annuus]